jgi:hypothetical protein
MTKGSQARTIEIPWPLNALAASCRCVIASKANDTLTGWVVVATTHNIKSRGTAYAAAHRASWCRRRLWVKPSNV